MTKLKTLAAAVALLTSGLASAWTVVDAGEYTVEYDETTTFGDLGLWDFGGGKYGFQWSVSTAVGLSSLGGAATSATFDLPSFVLKANPGYALGGLLESTLGNLVYADFSGSTSVVVNATVNLSGSGDVVLPTMALGKTATNAPFGYFSGTSSLSLAGVTSVEVKDATVTLSATAGSMAGISSNDQNKLAFTFTATPVPEPESYGLLLAGLGVVGLLARRRQVR